MSRFPITAREITVSDRATERFMRFVYPDPNCGCWLWSGMSNDFGYGLFRLGPGQPFRAHRYAYEAFRGPIPGRLLVLHRCDLPACVNPDHLFLGTTGDNVADKVSKGRQKKGPLPYFASRHTMSRRFVARAGRGEARRYVGLFDTHEEALSAAKSFYEKHFNGER